MFAFKQAEELAGTWVRLASDDTCEISQVDDKPYGWVFHYRSKDFDPDDLTTCVAGNAPIIIDRADFAVVVTGTASPLEHYLEEYEKSLPEGRLQMIPERHGRVCSVD